MINSLLLCLLGLSAADPKTRPNILYILVDDFGWADADWHRPDGWSESATPKMSSLIRNGIELDQFYAFKFCSPSRSAIQSGRNPIHVNVQNYQPVVWNWKEPQKDPVSGFAGIPRNMTGMAAVMKRGGYATHFVGKWDVGMATKDHTPRGRGYDSSLFYFHHDNDYWTSRVRASDRVSKCPGFSEQFVDLWQDDAPAYGLNNSGDCAVSCPKGKHCEAYPTTSAGVPDPNCKFEDALFHERVMDIVRGHNLSKPLFLFWAAHSIHTPLQVPKEFLDLYEHIDDWRRQRYLAMVRWLDSAIGDVVDLLEVRGMLNNTLIVSTSDNGGPVYFGGNAGANNYPLRGGKTSNWQGGIRVNAWVSGGLLPENMRGKKLTGLGAVWDWYSTFAHLAGEDPTDHKAAAANLPPIDSINLWPYLSGQASTSPRQSLPIGSTTCQDPSVPNCINQWGWGNVSTIVEGLIEDRGEDGLWKLLVGRNPMSGWQGPKYPNISTASSAFGFDSIGECGPGGCLFRIDRDPSEYEDLVHSKPIYAAQMLATLQKLNKTTFSPDRGPGEGKGTLAIEEACKAAKDLYREFWGPFLEMEASPSQVLV